MQNAKVPSSMHSPQIGTNLKGNSNNRLQSGETRNQNVGLAPQHPTYNSNQSMNFVNL